jgi:DNA adenine methylase
MNIIKNASFSHYHEPFLGGGSVFLSLDTRYKSYLSDLNEDLITTYISLRDNPEAIIRLLSQMPQTHDEYYKQREKVYEDSAYRAAQFRYLNEASYNGLYRVNKQGRYNVPYGYRCFTVNGDRLRKVSGKLQNARIVHSDFENNKYIIKRRDLVFLDPPYTVTHNNNGFIKYNQNLFSIEDQIRLSRYIDYIKKKDAFYILTNAAHPEINNIFEKDDRRITVNRISAIGGKNAKRQMVEEYIFTNIPQEGLL